MPSASGQFRIVCPECHNEKRKCFVDGTGKGLHCKHCAWSSSWKAFLRRYEPPTPEEVALESFVTKAQKTLLETPAILKYLLDRGLSHETIQKARLGYFNSLDAVPTEADFSVGLAYPPHNWVLGEHIIIPYIRDGYVITVRGRNMTGNEAKKYMSLAHSNPGLYHTGPENFENPVYVGEGEFDALMLRQYGYQSVGSPGASYPMRDELLQYGRIYACFDGDAAGLQAVTKFKKELPEFYHVSLPDGMDVTDYINNFEADSFQSLVNNAVLYVDGKPQREDRLTKNVDDWSDWAWSNGELLGPRIGWAPRLEKSLSGWSTGLIVLGALPNSGKSCFFVKSAYECALANQEDTVAVYLSLDDDQEDALTRVVSLHTGLSFEEVRVPRWSFDHPTDPKRRDREKLEYFYKKLEELKRLDNLIIREPQVPRCFNRELGREVREVTPEGLEWLRGYPWPGNIRELQSVLKQALLKASGPVLLPAFLALILWEGPAERADRCRVQAEPGEETFCHPAAGRVRRTRPLRGDAPAVGSAPAAARDAAHAAISGRPPSCWGSPGRPLLPKACATWGCPRRRPAMQRKTTLSEPGHFTHAVVAATPPGRVVVVADLPRGPVDRLLPHR